jgi:hypothetical protein
MEATEKRAIEPEIWGGQDWIEQELAASTLPDARLDKRLRSLVRTALRLTNLLAVFCILSWRVFWLTRTNRIDPGADPELVFTDLELRILDRLVKDKPTARAQKILLSNSLTKLARLDVCLARNSDPPPGNETIWRGLTRLVDIQLGVIMGMEMRVIERAEAGGTV